MIIARSPLRITLGGGGTDLPSYTKITSGFMVSAAIQKYVYVAIQRTFLPGITLKYSQTEHVSQIDDIKHPIIREMLRLRYGPRPCNLEISSHADIPSGTGLGSSGAFAVALAAALAALELEPVKCEQVAKTACLVNMDILQEPQGPQDEYISAFGGIQGMVFKYPRDVLLSSVLVPHDELASRLTLCYVGGTREARSILDDQRKRTEAMDQAMIDNLHKVRAIGVRSAYLLANKDYDSWAKLLDEQWLIKKERSAGMTNQKVDCLYNAAKDKGAIGAKLVGAGGNGFLLCYSHNTSNFREAMNAMGVMTIPVTFSAGGVTTRVF
jgi:D-glycero-alpha-D-manno-heptose-7-phosphate kinase